MTDAEIADEIAEELIEAFGWDNQCDPCVAENIFMAAYLRHGLASDGAARVSALVKFQLVDMLHDYRTAQGVEAAPVARVLN